MPVSLYVYLEEFSLQANFIFEFRPNLQLVGLSNICITLHFTIKIMTIKYGFINLIISYIIQIFS